MGTFDHEREGEKAFPDCCQPNSSESLGSVRHFLEESNCTFSLFNNTYPLWRTGDIDEKRHWVKIVHQIIGFLSQGHWRRRQVVV